MIVDCRKGDLRLNKQEPATDAVERRPSKPAAIMPISPQHPQTNPKQRKLGFPDALSRESMRDHMHNYDRCSILSSLLLFSFNLLTGMSHGGLNDPFQRSRLKIQFAFALAFDTPRI